MQNLLIIGGTLDPRQSLVVEEERLLNDFLKLYKKETTIESSPGENHPLHFALPDPYYPFKTNPVMHHRISNGSVTGLAELILEEEAASIGITSKIIRIDEVIDERWRLRDPTLLSKHNMIAFSSTYIPIGLLFYLMKFLPIPPNAKVFIGGPGVFKAKDSELKGIRFNYLLNSEAEGRFRKLLQHAMGKDIDLDKIPGLIWREENKLFYSSQPHEYIDINSASLPDYKRMASAQCGKVIYESTRGCPFRCEFCDYPFLMNNNKFRYKSAEKIFHDWKTMNESMQVTDILCLDSTFTHPPKRLKELCDLLCDSGLNKKMRWGCYARPDDLADLETTERIREAGCEYVYIGLESGSQQVLDYMNKKCTIEDNRSAVINCSKAGIASFGLFIAGFPGETPEMFNETKNFLRETPPYLISVVPWMPDFTDNTKVPIMQPDRKGEFDIQLEYPSAKKITLWRRCTIKQSVDTPWGLYWSHRGMDIQEAWDGISEVIQDIYDMKIKTLCEELYLPRTLDDPLTLFKQLGANRAVDFYIGLSRHILGSKDSDFKGWCKKTGLSE